jgi:hypothetical protein
MVRFRGNYLGRDPEFFQSIIALAILSYSSEFPFGHIKSPSQGEARGKIGRKRENIGTKEA